jgi:basic amino acid/polyamine antiporter, APA family
MSIAGSRSSEGSPDGVGSEGDAPLAPSGLFVRKSSGLVRELGVRDAWAINTGAVNPTGIGFFFFVILAGFKGVDLTWPVLISFVGTLLLVFAYSQLVATMPRSGADYVYASRAIHPALGSAVGFALFVAVLISAGAVDVYELANTYLPFVFQTLGELLHSQGLVTFAGTLAEKGWTLFVSALTCLAMGWLLLKRIGILAKATLYAVLLGVLGVLVLIVEFLTHGTGAFRAAFDAHEHNRHAYQQLITAAHRAGVSTGVKTSAVLSSIALVNFLYIGVTYANYTGGELRKPGRTYLSSATMCLVVTMLLTVGAWLAFKHTVGLPFSQAAGWLSANQAPTYSKIAGDVTAYVPAFANLIASNPVSKIVIAVGFASGVVAIVFAIGGILVRLLFAMSFDRVLPTAVSDVRAKSHAPVTAGIIVTVLMFVTTALVVYTSVLQVTRNLGLILAGVFAISSFIAMIMPWRQRSLYQLAAKPLGENLLGIPVITIVGGLSGAYWTVALYLGATKTQVSGGYE